MENELKNSKLGDRIPVSDIQLQDGYSAKAKVVKMHDGDSCHVHIIYGQSIIRFNCRLAEIDTPELGKPNSLKARDYLAHLCTRGGENSFDEKAPRHSELDLQNILDDNKSLVYVIFQGRGYYQRALVTVQREERSAKSFNKMLVEKGYAKVYVKPR